MWNSTTGKTIDGDGRVIRFHRLLQDILPHYSGLSIPYPSITHLISLHSHSCSGHLHVQFQFLNDQRLHRRGGFWEGIVACDSVLDGGGLCVSLNLRGCLRACLIFPSSELQGVIVLFCFENNSQIWLDWSEAWHCWKRSWNICERIEERRATCLAEVFLKRKTITLKTIAGKYSLRKKLFAFGEREWETLKKIFAISSKNKKNAFSFINIIFLCHIFYVDFTVPGVFTCASR